MTATPIDKPTERDEMLEAYLRIAMLTTILLPIELRLD
jgi:hypothetical protein